MPSQFDPFPGPPRIAVIFPGALGDFLCFAPALSALRREEPGSLLVVARSEWLTLLDPTRFGLASIDGQRMARLFAPGGAATLSDVPQVEKIYSWTGYDDPDFHRRIHALARAEARLFAFRDFAADEHAVDYYARCLAVRPCGVDLWEPVEATAWAERLASSLAEPLLAIHPGSGSPRKNWEGFQDLAATWTRRGGQVLELRGPAETGRPPLAAAAEVIAEPLPRVAALLRRASFYAGNDSGITHLAAALGVAGVALWGDTSLVHWCPRSASLRVVAADPSCPRCNPSRLCLHRLPLERVLPFVTFGR